MTIQDEPLMTHELIEEILSFDDAAADQADFDADLLMLKATAEAMIRRIGHHLYYPCGSTVEDQLREGLSAGVRRAISDRGWVINVKAWADA